MLNLLARRSPAPRTILLALLVGVAIGLPACLEERYSVNWTNGTVVYVPLEGGFYGIIADDGIRWDPGNLSDSFAIDSLRVAFTGIRTDHPTVHMWGRTIDIISIRKIADPPKISLEPFRELARKADCADVQNRLFLIDGQVVFWDRESTCADAAYARHLYGRTVERLICSDEDSIAGPRHACNNAGRYKSLFETVLENLDKPDLGLGPGRVEPVDF